MENNQYSYINRRFYASIFCALFSTLLFAFEGDIVSHLNFKKLPALNNLPTDEIQKVYQDKEALSGWLAVTGFINMMAMRQRYINQIFTPPVY